MALEEAAEETGEETQSAKPQGVVAEGGESDVERI